jgi:ketosteroid isomerase-like protein
VWADAARDFRVETKRQFSASGQVASENVAHATHTGVLRTPSGELPPTGRTLAGPYVGLFAVRDGRIVSQTIYFDQVGLMTQLGVLPG